MAAFLFRGCGWQLVFRTPETAWTEIAVVRKYNDEFKAIAIAMWNDGKLAREIAAATGITTSKVADFIQYNRAEFPKHKPGKPISADWHKPEIVSTIRKLIAAGANYKMIKAAVLKQHGVILSTSQLSGALRVLHLRLEPQERICAAWRQPDIMRDIRDFIMAGRNYKSIIDHVSQTYGLTLSKGMVAGAICGMGIRRKTNEPDVEEYTAPTPFRTSTLPPLRSELLRQQQRSQHD